MINIKNSLAFETLINQLSRRQLIPLINPSNSLILAYLTSSFLPHHKHLKKIIHMPFGGSFDEVNAILICVLCFAGEGYG
jgi:hypothetical protein